MPWQRMSWQRTQACSRPPWLGSLSMCLCSWAASHQQQAPLPANRYATLVLPSPSVRSLLLCICMRSCHPARSTFPEGMCLHQIAPPQCQQCRSLKIQSWGLNSQWLVFRNDGATTAGQWAQETAKYASKSGFLSVFDRGKEERQQTFVKEILRQTMKVWAPAQYMLLPNVSCSLPQCSTALPDKPRAG